ncbi:hypothetical protein [Kribbella sp. CA-293567]|uniref:hypothetical protein n=1 Tax=Kribbella sp. CA-293567 TaxID=3002436 RepID=UPI0022DDE297|nr:hypothetical protein [Kribbella sp. CA-293567]WBQ03498.1 hypothetical protein OX958_26425 [Kribbella sp. CA-293567]
MPTNRSHPLRLRLLLSSTAVVVSILGALLMSSRELPILLSLGLALVAAFALIDVAGILSLRHSPQKSQAGGQRLHRRP